VTSRPDSVGRVRVPADVDRPDRILAGLTARQLALLAAAAVGLWAAYEATRQFVPLAAFAAVAVPLAVAVVALALGRVDGQPADRFAAAAVSFHRSARHLVPAPAGIGPVPTGLAGRAGTPPAPLRLPLADVDQRGVADLGPDGTAIACRARAVPFKLRTPAEQEAMVAGFARFLNSLSEPIQILVRAEPVDLSPAIDALETAAPGLAHPALEAAARAHASFLADLGGRGLLSRQVLVVLRQPAATGRAATGGHGDSLVRRAADCAASLAAVGVTVEALDHHAAIDVLARAFDPAGPPTVPAFIDDTPITTSFPPDPGATR
jgi:hypothetical protein